MISQAVSLAAAVALLLFSVRLVRTGIERAFLAEIRVLLRGLAQRRIGTAAGGVAAAMMLQSSTAVALIAGGFASAGMIAPEMALVMLLGADLGSAAMALVLSLPVAAAVPFVMLTGVVMFLNARRRRTKQIGRILIGLSLVLISLGMIREAAAPIAASSGLQSFATHLSGDLPSAFVFGAAVGWLLHSGLAAVLVFVTFAVSGFIAGPAGAALVLGANLGASVVPVLLLSQAAMPARLMAFGNLIARGAVAVAALMLLMVDPTPLSWLGPTLPLQLLFLHLALNAVVAVTAIPVAGPLIRLASRIVPEIPETQDDAVSALDDGALDKPRIALVCAQREVLRMAEQVHAMLASVIDLFRTWDDVAADGIDRREDEVDRMHYAIKIYVSQLRDAGLSERQDARALDLVAMANNLEDAGDSISTGLVQQARKLRSGGVAFSSEGMADIERFHYQVQANAQLALNVLTRGDAEDARQLVAEKDRIRAEEQILQDRHLRRLGTGNSASVDTTNIHQETLRLLKQVNSAFTYVAYPIAQETGDLLDSRLAQPQPPELHARS